MSAACGANRSDSAGGEADRPPNAEPIISARELSVLLAQPTPTPEQAAVIESPLAPAVVIAGAGSGKTETMAARVVWLVANRIVRPDDILGLTFTRKAAAELGRRVRRRLTQWRHVVERQRPDEQDRLAELLAGEPTVLTYAAYAGRLVGEHALRIGAEPDARLISRAVSWQLADEVSRRHPGTLPGDIGAPSSVPKYLLAMSDQFADHLASAGDVETYCTRLLDWFETLDRGDKIRSDYPAPTDSLITSTLHRRELLPLVKAFAAAKRARSSVDFGDQMRIAHDLAGLPEVRAVERGRFAAVLLDEYQDTGHAQIATLRALFGDGHPVTAVGDPFQSIYGWRGASAGNIGRFAGLFTTSARAPATVFPLATSFRNDRVILDVANAIAAPLRSGPTMPPLRPAAAAGPGTLRIARTETVEDEARWVARQMRITWDALPGTERTAAVLVRRRSQIPLLSEALLAEGLPVEVVGLGGLLTTPEVLDVVSTLRVLIRADTGTSLARLLTGARWRIGPRDLAALHARARRLTAPPQNGATTSVPSMSEQLSLVEALDDLGNPQQYSDEGFRRLSRLSDELRRLRSRTTAPLPELVADVERSSGIDIEVASRPDRAHIGRVHLDRFLDVAADFAAEADEAGLSAFLAFLDAAEDEENGLEAGEIVVDAERVQVLTVHGAKGLEWDVVAVPGLVSSVFPAKPMKINWAKAREQLPGPLRGDRGDLPALDLSDAVDRKDVRDRLKAHDSAMGTRHAEEERRLAYVALTRARTTLLASGYVWDTNLTAHDPSPFLDEIRTFAEPDEWFEPAADATNPLTAQARTALWPLDPLGPFPGDRGDGRRVDVEAGAGLVRAAASMLPMPVGARAQRWRHDVDRLLAERAALARGSTLDVELPRHLSVSQLVELERDPAELARSIRRPLPRRPAPWARRGTEFHTWLEQRWDAQVLLDLDDLPGAADETAGDDVFEQLRAAFLASEWATRTPTEVEVPFETVIGDRVIRGRMDAVFGDERQGWQVVDWKTGSRPRGAAARAAAVQLAAYRLAWARLRGLGDDRLGEVRAAFHYVRDNDTVEPTALLDADGLRALVLGADDPPAKDSPSP